MAVVLQRQREEAMAVVLEELLQEELGGSCQERVLTVRGTDVLGWHDGHRAVRHLPGRGTGLRPLRDVPEKVLELRSLAPISRGWERDRVREHLCSSLVRQASQSVSSGCSARQHHEG